MRLFVVDTIASIVFFTISAFFTELWLVGLTLSQAIDARIAAVPAMMLTSRPYGWYRDRAFERAGQFGRTIPGRVLTDIAAFLSFQIPVYVAVLSYAGANWEQIIKACAIAVGLMLVLARPFGLFLEGARRAAGLPGIA